MGDFRSRKYIILPRADLPDPAGPFSTRARNKVYFSNVPTAVTDKPIHAQLTKIICGMYRHDKLLMQSLSNIDGQWWRL